MQIFVRTPEARTITMRVDKHTLIENVKSELEDRLGVQSEQLRLYFGGRALQGVKDNNTLHLLVAVEGGTMDPTIAAIAKKFNCEKKVCRKCYATLPIKATNCRKRKCGHSNQLRLKKKAKD